jgi:hypothetical protein
MIGALSELTSPLLFCAFPFFELWVPWRSFKFSGFLVAIDSLQQWGHKKIIW